jgi:hypothetical protein
MHFIKSSMLSVLFTLWIGIPLTANCQIYQIYTSLHGYTEFYLTDWGNTVGAPVGGSYGGQTSVLFFDDDIYIDPAAQTIRQVGSIQAGFYSDDTRTVIKSIGGQSVSASIEVIQRTGYPNSIQFQFDTGAKPYTWDSSLQMFTFDGRLPCSGAYPGSYSLVTGGQTLTGNFICSLSGNIYGYTQFSLETNITVGSYSSTFRNLSGWGAGATGPEANDFSGVTGVNVTATNRFSLVLGAGLNDGLDFFRATADSQWANLVPEPSSVSVLGLGLAALAVRRRYQT